MSTSAEVGVAVDFEFPFGMACLQILAFYDSYSTKVKKGLGIIITLESLDVAELRIRSFQSAPSFHL